MKIKTDLVTRTDPTSKSELVGSQAQRNHPERARNVVPFLRLSQGQHTNAACKEAHKNLNLIEAPQ